MGIGGGDGAEVSPGEQSVLPSRRGVSAGLAIVIALTGAGIGIAAEALRGASDLSGVLLGCYAAGCVVAVLAVRRRALFTAMVQPPLILAVTVPVATQVLGGGGGSTTRDRLIGLALPLVNSFPVMAATTAVTVGTGIVRIVRQRRAAATAQAATTSGRAERAAAPDQPGRGNRGPDGRFSTAGELGGSKRATSGSHSHTTEPSSTIERYRHQAARSEASAPVPRRERRREPS